MRSLVRLTTGVELGVAAITVFIAAGLVALVSVGMTGSPRLLVEGFVIAAALGVVASTGAGIWRRRQRLLNGRCGHPVCHGEVERRDSLPDHLVECSNCRRVWPLLQSAPEEVAAG